MIGRRLIVIWLIILMAALPGEAGTLVQIFTDLGEIDVELFDQEKPVTVRNFLRLVQAGVYQNCFFHRCVPGFILQGGGFISFNRTSTSPIGPPWTNTGSVFNFGTITNEINVGPFRSNTYGTIAMAKMSDPDSATSEFFFNLANNSASLDDPLNSGGFTVFGRVVRGTNILNQFNTISKGHNLVDLRDSYGTNDSIAAIFKELPTYALGTNAPPYNQLIYFAAAVVSVQVALKTNGAREISWNSVQAVSNLVEFTTSFPPTWQTLFSTNGSGGMLKITDPSTNAPRFYRVRMNF